MGFILPLECWMNQELKSEIEETLFEKNTLFDAVLNKSSVLNIWRDFLSGKVTWQRPWSLYVLKKWVNNYLI